MFPCFQPNFPCVPLFPKSIFFRVWCSLFPKISKTQLPFSCSQLYFPFVLLFPIILWPCSLVNCSEMPLGFREDPGDQLEFARNISCAGIGFGQRNPRETNNKMAARMVRSALLFQLLFSSLLFVVGALKCEGKHYQLSFYYWKVCFTVDCDICSFKRDLDT